MAVTFTITSSREVTINGIGLLRENELVQVDELMSARFEAEHGYRLSEAKLPDFVKVTAVVNGEDPQTDDQAQKADTNNKK